MFRAAPRIEASYVSGQLNPPNGRFRRKYPTHFVSRYPTHTIWKRCLQNILLVADYSSVQVLIDTRFMDCHVNSTRYNDRQAKFKKGKIPPLGSAKIEPTVRELEYLETSDRPTKKMDYYLVIMRHQVASREHITLPPHTQVSVKLVTKISGFFHTKLTQCLWSERPSTKQ